MIVDVEPLSPAADAGLQRGHVLLEVDRRPIHSMASFDHMARAVGAGRVVSALIYAPELGQRQVKAVRVDGR